MHLKFKEEEEDQELIRFIKDGLGNFDLPKFINFPRGERAMTSRARMLMIAGLEALKKEYPKKKENDKTENEISSLNNMKIDNKNNEIIVPKGW